MAARYEINSAENEGTQAILAIAFGAIVGFAEKLAIFGVCGAAFGPGGYVVGIHFR